MVKPKDIIDKYKRYQTGLNLLSVYPQLDGVCSCGCGKLLPKRRKRWYSNECNKKAVLHFLILKGDQKAIRSALFEQDKGFCRICGVFDPNWEADHILPVHKGGGGCTIENFQTLCKSCHLEKSISDNRRYNQ